jgi:hypothetical protein
MKKEKKNDIEKLVFDCQTKEAATEFCNDIIAAGVPAESCKKIRKVPKTEIYRLTVTNDNDEIQIVIKMLLGPEYGMSLEEIQNFLKIQFVLPDA